MAFAQIIKSGLCRTTAKCRPNPTMFFMPGLNTTPWHDADSFAWCRDLEDRYEEIKGEYVALREREIKSDYEVLPGEHTLHKGEWDWFSHISAGKKQPRFAELCPTTAQILDGLPGLMTGLPFAYAFFSSLKPGASIAPHTSPCNLRLRCHFPIFTSDGSGMRVGEESRAWEAGKCTVFDDSYDHEVWHNGKEERVVLLFDMWHPDLTAAEISAIQDMFAAAMPPAGPDGNPTAHS